MELSKEDIIKLKSIAKIINDRKRYNKKLNRYEYYMLGGISFKKSEKVLAKLYSNNLLTATEFNTLYVYVQKEQLLGASRNKEFIMNTYYRFGDTVITDQEKQMIWDKLNNLGLDDSDIDDLVFSAAVREYAKQRGLIPSSKKLIRKK